MAAILFILYLAATVGLLLHTFFFSWLLRGRRHAALPAPSPLPPLPEVGVPLQLVQLPVCNEDPGMVGALIDSACALRYPKSRLVIQVLDDSDQEGISRGIREHVAGRKAADPERRLEYLHRNERTDYKAGNLNHGLEAARRHLREEICGDPDHVIVSIFDADFVIPEDYLEKVACHFTALDVCAVQASIRYINGEENVLTRTQSAFLTNLHLMDFSTRGHAGHLTTFRGSAGSWRLSAIEALGGWSGDTQIEDVDLSMAAQLSGLRIVYLDDLWVSSRLPAGYNGYKLQQRSWMKGIMEVWRKHGRGILTSPNLHFRQRIMAADLFLVLSLQPLYMISHHLLAIPSYHFLQGVGLSDEMGYAAAALAVLLNVSHIPFVRSHLAGADAEVIQAAPAAGRIRDHVASILVSLGMFATFTSGLLEGILGFRVHREPTQKSGGGSAPRGILPARHLTALARITAMELVLAAYSLFFVLWALPRGQWGLLLLYGPFALGYPWVMVHSLAELRGNTKKTGSRGPA
ncbi:MAG: glycosyltransferase [bacterium]|nr:MAG: glycosyltransferase [bacterium]